MALRLTLPLKFFLAFLMSSLTIVILMIVIMQYFAYLNFTDYVRTTEIRRLNELSDMLSEEYQLGEGWDLLRNNRERWRYLLRPLHPGPGNSPPRPPRKLSSLHAAVPDQDWQQDRPPRPPGNDHFRNNRDRRQPPPRNDRFRRRPPPPDDEQFRSNEGNRRGPPPNNKLSQKEGLRTQSRPPREDRKPGNRPPRFGIEHRLTLFDINKKTVAGPASSPIDHTLKNIISDNQTVGWLGLKKEDQLTQPLDIAFLKQQAQAFYMTGALMLTLAAITAFFFARHLLAPIKQLTAGTRALKSRNFESRIPVKSKDELGQLASDFNQMAQTLENYEQMRHQWISDIAHELRTPLSVLQGEIEALQDGVRQINPDTLSSLHTEVSHLTRLVCDLHDLSLAESGSLHYSLEPVAPLALVRDIIKKFRPLFEARKIVLLDELDNEISQTIPGDSNRLVQVFSNLFENSLRYTEPPGTLKIRSSITSSGISLYFEDSAPGVSHESLKKLFDRLYRVDKSRSRAHGGSGLGLAICKSIIEAHNGTIRALKSPLGGVLFEITLPHNL